MNIVDDRDAWFAHFSEGFLAHHEATGETDFKQYRYVKNTQAPSGPGLDLASKKLLLVTSSGAYLRRSQAAFDAPNPLGDYGVRALPQSTPLDEIAFAHEHYDHRYVDEDAQAVLPLRLMETLASEGRVGALAEMVVSFHGYTPDITRVLDETIPEILGMAKAQQVDAALLVPV